MQIYLSVSNNQSEKETSQKNDVSLWSIKINSVEKREKRKRIKQRNYLSDLEKSKTLPFSHSIKTLSL